MIGGVGVDGSSGGFERALERLECRTEPMTVFNFVVGDRGIYFLAVGDSASKTSIDFFEFSTRRRTTLAKVGKPWWSGIALSADQGWLLFATIDRDGSDLMLVDRIP